MHKLAFLLTCYNRFETTIKCLTSIYQQKIPLGLLFEIFLVDDGSTDGTEIEVRQKFPNVIIIKGTGNLFWAGGMRLAWSEALKYNFDSFLWLNDDTILLPNAIESLITVASKIKNKDGVDGIVVGSCYDSDSGKQSYGGRMHKKQNRFVTPTNAPQQCDLINGNIVLIPCNIQEKVGNISQEFIHYGGDNDYGQRVIKAGFKVWVAPGYQATCSSNTYAQWADPKVPICERWRILHSPKGQPPYEVYIYAKLHKNSFWLLDLLKLYLKVLNPDFYRKFKKLFLTKD